MILQPDCTVRLLDVREIDSPEEIKPALAPDDYRRPAQVAEQHDFVTLYGRFIGIPKRRNKRLLQGSVIESDRKIAVTLGEGVELELGLQVEIVSQYFGAEVGRLDGFCSVPGICNEVILEICLKAGHGNDH